MIVSNPPGPFRPTWDSLENYVVPEWYLDAKFGIFIHWGPYSVPAFGNEWYPRNMYVRGTREFEHHARTFGPQDRFGYKDFVPLFRAERFDAREWADLFAEAGARYVVPVAEHHDGFAMYRSRLTRWNAAEMGPRRDVLGELATAVRERGLTFGLSSHRAEHWWFFNGGREFPSDVQDPRLADFYGPAHPGGYGPGENPPSEAFLEDWLRRCAELVDSYRPQLFWFDWWIEQPEFAPYLRRFASYYYNRAAAWGQGVAINYKNEAFPARAAVWDVERGQLASIRESFWQTDTAVAKNSWGYVEGMDYKQPRDLIHDLVDIVSKNGCLLLNVGPRADGTIPEEDRGILLEMGAWLRVHGEAVYGTRPWKVYGEGPTEVVEGAFKDTERQPFTSEDIRFTTRDDRLYAIALGEPAEELLVRSLATGLALEPRPVTQVDVLGGPSQVPFEQTAAGLAVRLPRDRTARHAVALRIRFAG
ncbi:MAG: alpha-L-fucosidase [Fimbriimonadales bacterium]|nr:alpha-L-fucosidase [Fimbriimonadales bacterium]